LPQRQRVSGMDACCPEIQGMPVSAGPPRSSATSPLPEGTTCFYCQPYIQPWRKFFADAGRIGWYDSAIENS